MTFAADFIDAIWETGKALAPSLFLGLFIAGLLHVFVKRDRIFRHMGKPGIISVIKASLIGVPLPLCSCGVLPAALSLRKDGASKGAAVSFLSSTPQTGVDSIAPTWAMLGWPVALAKVVAAFAAGVISGTAVDLIEKGNGHEIAPANHSSEETGPVFLRIWNYAYGTLFRDIYLWLMIGIAVSALITVFIEPGQLSEYPILNGPLGMLAALAIGIPLYVCSVSSIPIAAALVYAGFPVGSALVFLMAGPVTNAATMGAVRKNLGRTSFMSYIITVIAVSILAGFLLNGLDIPAGTIMHHHEDSSILQIVSASLLFLGIGLLAANDIHRRMSSPVDSSSSKGIVYLIEGMSCKNCVKAVSDALAGVQGVTGTRILLESSSAVVYPGEGYSEQRVLSALTKAGHPGKPAEVKDSCCDGTCKRG